MSQRDDDGARDPITHASVRVEARRAVAAAGRGLNSYESNVLQSFSALLQRL